MSLISRINKVFLVIFHFKILFINRLNVKTTFTFFGNNYPELVLKFVCMVCCYSNIWVWDYGSSDWPLHSFSTNSTSGLYKLNQISFKLTGWLWKVNRLSLQTQLVDFNVNSWLSNSNGWICKVNRFTFPFHGKS